MYISLYYNPKPIIEFPFLLHYLLLVKTTVYQFLPSRILLTILLQWTVNNTEVQHLITINLNWSILFAFEGILDRVNKESVQAYSKIRFQKEKSIRDSNIFSCKQPGVFHRLHQHTPNAKETKKIGFLECNSRKWSHIRRGAERPCGRTKKGMHAAKTKECMRLKLNS